MHPDNKTDNYKKITIKTKKLDDFEIVNRIGFIKIDVEGHEAKVCLGLTETIRKNRPTIALEWNNDQTKNEYIY